MESSDVPKSRLPKILSYHYFSLYTNGGGSRILRRLYSGRESQIQTLIVVPNTANPAQNRLVNEVVVEATPRIRRWMKGPIRNWAYWLREKFLRELTIDKMRKTASTLDYDIIHVVDHGPFSSALCTPSLLEGKKLWVSFHDHFLTMGSSTDIVQTLWSLADRRLVISKQLGDEYSKLFGHKKYELITDGVTLEEVSTPKQKNNQDILIYFAGLLHFDYYPLFQSLANALDKLAEEGQSLRLKLRGTQQLDFLKERKFAVDYLPFSLDVTELKTELDEADILYLPIKFTDPNFYLYSLSTKMVGYLGAPGVIVYHGPEDSAACLLLKETNSGICCSSLESSDVVNSINQAVQQIGIVSSSAKELVKEQFILDNIQKKFWQDDRS